jgi:hypothetical protein
MKRANMGQHILVALRIATPVIPVRANETLRHTGCGKPERVTTFHFIVHLSLNANGN